MTASTPPVGERTALTAPVRYGTHPLGRGATGGGHELQRQLSATGRVLGQPLRAQQPRVPHQTGPGSATQDGRGVDSSSDGHVGVPHPAHGDYGHHGYRHAAHDEQHWDPH